jgi:hypothetical protein
MQPVKIKRNDKSHRGERKAQNLKKGRRNSNSVYKNEYKNVYVAVNYEALTVTQKCNKLACWPKL